MTTQAGRLFTVNGVLGEANTSVAVVVSGSVNGITSDCLIDTWSVVSLVPRRMVGDDLRPTGIDHVKLRTVDGSTLQSDGELLVRLGY